MPTTSSSALPYPASSASPNVPSDIQALAVALDQRIITQVATQTARTALTSKYDGMRVYEQSTKRFYRWDGTASAWQYDGGAPPPVTAITSFGAFFAATAGFAPGCYKNASGEVCVVGGVTVSTTYTPAGNVLLTLPTGFFPAVTISVPIYVDTGTGSMLGGIYTDGTLKANVSGSIPNGTHHTVNFRFHPGFVSGGLA